MIVAGALMQRRAGGDLAQLLRSAARSFEDEARLLGEVRAATAQARFTGTVVVLLPLRRAIHPQGISLAARSNAPSPNTSLASC